MLRRVTALLVVSLLFSALATTASAELSAGQKMAADVLIKQFTDRSFAVRQQAVEKLIAVGPDVVPLIQKTLAETDDNEVKLRCRMVLAGIAKKHGITIEGTGEAPVPADRFGVEAAKITIKVTDAPLGEVLQELADKSGNKLIAVPDDWAGPAITLDVKDMPYWQVLDEVCRQSSLTPTSDYRTRGMRLMKVEEQPKITAYAGPAVVRLDSATKRQYFNTTSPQWQRDGLIYQFTCIWEERIQALAVSARVTRAVLPDGKVLVLGGANPGMGAYGMGAYMSIPYRAIYASFTDVPRPADRIAEMEGVVAFTTGTGKRELRIDNALGNVKAEGRVGTTTLKIDAVNRQRWGVTMTVTMTTQGDEKPVLDFPQKSEYGFVLIDPDGKRHEGRSYGYARAGGGMVVMNQGPGGAVVQVNPQNGNAGDDDEAKGNTRNGTLMFQNLPDIEGEWTLVGTFPAQTTTKEFTFKLKDVPIP